MIKKTITIVFICFASLGAGSLFYFLNGRFADLTEAKQVSCENLYDFGKISDFRNKLLTHIFLVSNLSNHVIKIQSIKTSCGCLVAQGNADIPPRSSSQILARMKIDGSVGVSRQKIILEYSDKSFSVITLQAFVSDQFMTFPPTLNLKVSANNTDLYTFKIIRKTPESSRKTYNFLTLSTHDVNVKLDITSGKIEDKKTHLVLISNVDLRITSPKSGVCSVIAKYSDGAIWPFAIRFD